MLEGGSAVGIRRDFFDATNSWLVGKTIGWTAYNPLRPEPLQRNVVLTLDEVMRVSGVSAAPILSEIYSDFGLARDDTARALVCEGASLLGYVGILQSSPIEPRQKRLLTRLIPAVRQRLSTDRLLTTVRSTRALLDAALQEIPTAAFILGGHGSVVETNVAGKAWLERRGLSGRQALRQAVRAPQRASVAGFRVTSVTAAGAASRSLVVTMGEPGQLPHLLRAGSRWRFTAREMTILEHLAEGTSTRTIAAELGVVERTIEAHLTRMFEKAQVESRAELVAKAWREGR
ncbi:MAG: response regulator transcription factor [Polyangiaceae bacterium]